MNVNTLCKDERLCSRLMMDRLFQGENVSVASYPIRAIFLPVEPSLHQGISILVSVPKKKFHHAVDRNRAKRQIREAYRIHKHELVELLDGRHQGLLLAFVYVGNRLEDSARIEQCMVSLLHKIKGIINDLPQEG